MLTNKTKSRETIVVKRFRRFVFFRCKKNDKQQKKKEVKKRTDKKELVFLDLF